MDVKTDTKEKFTVITPKETVLAANMTGDLSELLPGYLQKDIPHIVLNMTEVQEIDEKIGKLLAENDEGLALEAVRVLAEHPQAKRVGLLLDIVRDMRQTTAVRAQAIVGLAEHAREHVGGRQQRPPRGRAGDDEIAALKHVAV